ncbi:MAG: hypothetical protein GC162_06710 [Planctomycetes bacterium]|nr:hypothetical protein [Planctomycetota bacterium]
MKAPAGFRRFISRTRSAPVHLLVACFPKSGSTYLTTLLQLATGFARTRLVQCYGHNEQNFDRHEMSRKLPGRDTVTQQHVKGTDNNLDLIEQFDLKPIVLVRNLYDVVVSLLDHIEQRRDDGPASPVCYIHQNFDAMTRAQRTDYIIRMALPWYFQFLISWHEASARLDACWLTYEELFADQHAALSRISDFAQLDLAPDRIDRAIEEARGKATRFNRGITGRGRALADDHHSQIQTLAHACRVDPQLLHRIGIEL